MLAAPLTGIYDPRGMGSMLFAVLAVGAELRQAAAAVAHPLGRQATRFVPFGATSPLVCFSESPPQHLRWLLGDRGLPPWALGVESAT